MLSANSNFYQGNSAVVQDSYDIMGMFYRDKLNIIICMKRTNTGVVHCSVALLETFYYPVCTGISFKK